ncbi:MAG: sporulation initiation factor Spo0A C-terminal domain-containing protein [Oscillospiraceae bacterium]
MARKLSVLLIEDDQAACGEIIECIQQLSDVYLVGVTNSCRKALRIVQDFMPDAVILDLELNLGDGNGLIFLQQLTALRLKITPYVLVTTNNSSAVTYEQVRTLGADFIMAKHKSDYSAKNVVEFLRMMKNTLHSKASSLSLEHQTNETIEQKNKRIAHCISTELDKIGISPKAVGYQYLIDAISMVVQNPMNNICAAIAKKYAKSDASVERAIQNAIIKAWRTTDIDELTKYYTAKICSSRGVPTVNEFIFYFANKIRNEY